MSENFPSISEDGGNMGVEVRDPNNTAMDMDDANLPSMGKAQSKFNADLSGPSGVQQGANFADSSEASKGFYMPENAPGNGSGAITDNNGQGNSSGIPAAQPIDPLTFGDPNNTAIDASMEERHGF